jgi:hypothetical protein
MATVKVVLIVSDPEDSGVNWSKFRSSLHESLLDWLGEDDELEVDVIEPDVLN